MRKTASARRSRRGKKLKQIPLPKRQRGRPYNPTFTNGWAMMIWMKNACLTKGERRR